MWERTTDVKINFTYYYPCNYIPQDLINCYKIKIFTFYLILKLNFPQESSFVAYQVNLSVIIPFVVLWNDEFRVECRRFLSLKRIAIFPFSPFFCGYASLKLNFYYNLHLCISR